MAAASWPPLIALLMLLMGLPSYYASRLTKPLRDMTFALLALAFVVAAAHRHRGIGPVHSPAQVHAPRRQSTSTSSGAASRADLAEPPLERPDEEVITMVQLVVGRIVAARPEAVWRGWDDFGDIAVLNPESSHLLGNQPTGKGATRKFDMKDGRTPIRERIMDFVPRFEPLGVLMVSLTKPQVRRTVQGLLEGNAAHCESRLA